MAQNEFSTSTASSGQVKNIKSGSIVSFRIELNKGM